MNFTKNIATEQRKSRAFNELGVDIDDRVGRLDPNFSDLESEFVASSIYYSQYFCPQSDCFSSIEDIDANNSLFFSRFFLIRSIYLDFCLFNDILISGTACLFWGVITSFLNGMHQSIFWCIPRSLSYSYGRGDDGIYNRLRFLSKLKTIVTVLGGFINSPIANFHFRVFFYYLLVIIVLVISGLYSSQISFFNFLPLASSGGIAV